MKIDVRQVIRGVVMAFTFLCFAYLYGMDTREAQQYIFMLGGMILFGFLLDNIWISLFLWWTIFLQLFFKGAGSIYLSNIFFGCVLYYMTKRAFKKEHIDIYINCILWLVCINLFYMIVQVLGYDFVFKTALNTTEGFKGYVNGTDPSGFMGFKAAMAMLIAMAIPLLHTRGSRTARIGSYLMFIPLYLCQASICIIAAVLGLIWTIWHKVNWTIKKYAIFLTIIALISGGVIFYVVKIDNMPTSVNLRFVAWKGFMEDTIVHPITGWGLDSFRNITDRKKHIYAMNFTQMKTQKGVHFDYFDNPHNLYISLMYEWGVVGLIILIGLLRRWGLLYAKAIKEPNTIALSGFILVTLIVSIAQFPMFLSRMVVFIIPCIALYERQVTDD